MDDWGVDVAITGSQKSLMLPPGLGFVSFSDRGWAARGVPDAEREGRLRIVRNGVLDPRPVTGVPAVRAAALGGLLDVALHPKFAENKLVYLSYSKPGDNRLVTTAVARGRFDGTGLTDVKDIFVANNWSTSRRSIRSKGSNSWSFRSRSGRIPA